MRAASRLSRYARSLSASTPGVYPGSAGTGTGSPLAAYWLAVRRPALARQAAQQTAEQTAQQTAEPVAKQTAEPVAKRADATADPLDDVPVR